MRNLIIFFVLFLVTWGSKAQIINIPDSDFKHVLLIANASSYRFAKNLNGDWTVVDTNQDGEIQNSEAENILELKVRVARVNDLTGIEAFVNLTKLDCSKNNLTAINISTLPNLKEIDCSRNRITELNTVNNLQLEILRCGFNRLTNINVNSNTLLKILSFKSNLITILDVSNNTLLTELYLNSNLISAIDVSNNTSLKVLSCPGDAISTLNVTNNTLLKELNCTGTNISDLDISNNTQLNILKCGQTNITNLDMSNNSLISLLTLDNTNISTINVSNLVNLVNFHCQNTEISTIDISTNTKIRYLTCYESNITNLDLSNNIKLEGLYCSNLNLTNLDLTNNPNLKLLDFSSTNIAQFSDVVGLTAGMTNIICDSNNFTEIDVSDYVNLAVFSCSANNITTLDVSNNANLKLLDCRDNPNLSYINLKNGNNSNIILYNPYSTNFTNLPSLETVCVDELNTDLNTTILDDTGHSVTFTKYCSFIPTQSNQIAGNVTFDMNNNGCDMTDLSMPNIMVTTNNGTGTLATFTQNNGDYLLYTDEGNFATEVATNLPSYFTINPNLHSSNFTGFNNVDSANFCINPNQVANDLNITLRPISTARPNLNARYVLLYKNVGTTVLSGNIDLVFNGNLLDFTSATESISTQGTNFISFDYSDLNPFETRKITVNFKVSLNATINDSLDFTTTINPVLNDYSESDNTFTINQTIVNSYDPNDIHILEGDRIKIQDTHNYLHYLIRFQNTGTAEAINIVVTNELDDKLDWNTLQLEDTSHAMRTTISNGNKIEFIFENINLPDKTANESKSHGYIAYKIKLRDNISAGDTILNQAKIFFDYNAAIDTNIATTNITDNTASINNIKLFDTVLLYPNPTKDRINIDITNSVIVHVAIYSKLGQLILSDFQDNIKQIDISKLTKGMYIIKLVDNNGNIAIKNISKF